LRTELTGVKDTPGVRVPFCLKTRIPVPVLGS
jgi:hypothetical protein